MPAALKREVSEELGLSELAIGRHVSMALANIRIPLDADKTVGLILSIYECALPMTKASFVLSEDHKQYKWCSPEEAAELLSAKYPPELCELIAGLR